MVTEIVIGKQDIVVSEGIGHKTNIASFVSDTNEGRQSQALIALQGGAAAELYEQLGKYLNQVGDDMHVSVNFGSAEAAYATRLNESQLEFANKLWSKYSVSGVTTEGFGVVGSSVFTYDRFLRAMDNFYRERGKESGVVAKTTYEGAVQPGDVVHLKSGGPNMTVSYVDSDNKRGPMAHCVWSADEGMCYDGDFHVDALMKVGTVAAGQPEQLRREPVDLSALMNDVLKASAENAKAASDHYEALATAVAMLNEAENDAQ